MGQRFNERDTQSPDIAGRPNLPVLQLRRIMQRSTQNAAGQLARGTDGIAGQLQLITNNQQVGGLDLSLHQPISMQEIQCTQRGDEHVPGFIGTQRTPGQELGERLVGIFHNDVQVDAPTDMTPTNVEEADQMRVVQGSGRAPLDELCLGFQRIGRNELDGGLGDAFGSVLSEKYRAVVGSAEPAPQWIGAVDDLVFPPHPDFGLGDSSRFCTHAR